MVVLHASCLRREFLLWGEAAQADPQVGIARRRGRKPKSPQTYPYGAGADRLTAALHEVEAGIVTDGKARRVTVAWLPTCGGVPVASSPLIAEPLESQATPELAPWCVEALVLCPEQAVELLCACAGRQALAPGVAVGRDLAFWAQALPLAGALVAQHQYLPSVAGEDGNYRTCWEPVLAGADADRFAEFAKAMPPVARALTDTESTAAPATPASDVLRTFVNTMVDHLVRSAEGEPKYPRESAAISSDTLAPPPPKRGRPKKAPAFDSVHDQWLHALRTADGRMAGDARELAQFAEQVREWRRPVSVSTAAPFRLCFRLEEPEREGEAPAEPSRRAPGGSAGASPSRDGSAGASPSLWRVRFLLQATNDPSLLVPVRDAWKTRGTAAATLRREGFNIQEHLLASLGQAAGICPRIEASLKAAEPAGYELDATGAHEFLTARSIALEQAGFGVMLPAWWTRKGTKLRLTVRANVKSPKMQGGSGMSLEEIVHVDWEVALGGETLTLEELEALARLKAPLVQVRGQWVEMSAAEIEAALDFWRKKASGTVTVREVVQMALGASATPGGLALEGVAAEGWVGDVLGRLEGTTAFEELPAPGGFVGELRPYQGRGYSWLAFLRQWGMGACLADDMGLGKTIQTLALIQRDWEASPPNGGRGILPRGEAAGSRFHGGRPVLLVCPTSVVGNWQKEAARFTPGLPVMVHHGVERKRGAEFAEAVRGQAVVISSYALLHRDIEHLRNVSWAGIVLDEAQNIKNPQTKQAQAARALAADYRVALTGTPVENHVGDLWSIMEFLNPGFLGTQAEFKRGFFIPIQANRDPEAAKRLKQLTGPFVLRRLKSDKSIIADLPEKLEMKVFCTLTREQASLYAAVVKEAEGALEAADGIQRKGVILATLSKLKQVCNHPAQLLGDNSAIPGRSGKLARLTEMLEEILSVGDRALVFSQFSEMGELLRRHLQETFGREVLFLHGAVPKGKRDEMVARFQADGDGPPVFLLSLKAGGTGLNLTRASHVFHFDRWWNPAVENQATDRAFRIGQTRNVQVHKFLCAGTLEEKIDEMIERKKAVAENVVGAGEGWLTELSNTELKTLFALREEAIGE